MFKPKEIVELIIEAYELGREDSALDVELDTCYRFELDEEAEDDEPFL